MKLTEKLEELGNASQYEEQGKYFLEYCGVVYEAEKCVPQIAPDWAKDGKCGTQWNIKLGKLKKGNSITPYDKIENRKNSFDSIINFSFWGSIADKEKASHSYKGEKKPKAYDFLTSIYCGMESFSDFCDCSGYDSDSIEAFKTFQRCEELDAKLKTIFTRQQLEALSYIQ